MNTLLTQIQSLSELELAELIEGIKEHCYKNRMNHLFNYEDEEYTESLEIELSEMKIDMDNLQKKLEQSQIQTRDKIIDTIENMEL